MQKPVLKYRVQSEKTCYNSCDIEFVLSVLTLKRAKQSVPQSWTCSCCGTQNSNNFCTNCGASRAWKNRRMQWKDGLCCSCRSFCWLHCQPVGRSRKWSRKQWNRKQKIQERRRSEPIRKQVLIRSPCPLWPSCLRTLRRMPISFWTRALTTSPCWLRRRLRAVATMWTRNICWTTRASCFLMLRASLWRPQKAGRSNL